MQKKAGHLSQKKGWISSVMLFSWCSELFEFGEKLSQVPMLQSPAFVSLMIKGEGGCGMDKNRFFSSLSLYFCKLETFFLISLWSW